MKPASIVPWAAAGVLLAATFLLGALPQSARAAGLLVPVGGTESMTIAHQKVSVHINNGIAVTTVDQVFRNKAGFAQEAVYRFPVPEKGSVSNFSLWINGKEVVGEVLEKQKARQIYDEITATRRDPGLIEQTNYKWFEMRVSPVPANGEQRIQLTYYQPADYDAGYLVYTYPLETAGVAKTDLEGEFSVLVDVISQIPMEKVYSSSHSKETLVRQASPQRYRAGIEISKASLDRDFVLVCQLAREKTGIDLLTSRRDGKPGYFMLTVTPSAQLDRLAEPINYIFVLDVSGSMGQLGKLPLGRSAVEQMISDLRPEDRFNIVSFNIAPEAMARESLTGEQASKDKAKAYLSKLNAAGGTDLLSAMELALSLQKPDMRNAIVLLSDGQATTTEDHTAFVKLLSQQKTAPAIFSFGIGNDVNRPLLGALAERTGGFADYVSGQEDLARKVDTLRHKIDSPVMRDVRIDWGGQQVADVVPPALPPIYRGQQLVVFGRYEKIYKGPLTLSATIAGRTTTMPADIVWPERDNANPEVERMWAQRACEALNGAISAGQGGEKERRQIIELGTTFSIVTPYTSFLVLENEAQFSRYGIDRLNKQRVENERAQQDTRNAWNPAPADRGSQIARNDPPRWHIGGGGGGGGGAIEGTFLGLLGLLLASAVPGWIRARKEG